MTIWQNIKIHSSEDFKNVPRFINNFKNQVKYKKYKTTEEYCSNIQLKPTRLQEMK